MPLTDLQTPTKKQQNNIFTAKHLFWWQLRQDAVREPHHHHFVQCNKVIVAPQHSRLKPQTCYFIFHMFENQAFLLWHQFHLDIVQATQVWETEAKDIGCVLMSQSHAGRSHVRQVSKIRPGQFWKTNPLFVVLCRTGFSVKSAVCNWHAKWNRKHCDSSQPKSSFLVKVNPELLKYVVCFAMPGFQSEYSSCSHTDSETN